jgi:putative membrane protein
MMMRGVWGVGWGLGWLIAVAAVVALAVMLLRGRRGGVAGSGAGSSALDALDLRYAQGAIEREDYLRRRNDIIGGGPDGVTSIK